MRLGVSYQEDELGCRGQTEPVVLELSLVVAAGLLGHHHKQALAQVKVQSVKYRRLHTHRPHALGKEPMSRCRTLIGITFVTTVTLIDLSSGEVRATGH
jgi:hypothetical protein